MLDCWIQVGPKMAHLCVYMFCPCCVLRMAAELDMAEMARILREAKRSPAFVSNNKKFEALLRRQHELGELGELLGILSEALRGIMAKRKPESVSGVIEAVKKLLRCVHVVPSWSGRMRNKTLFTRCVLFADETRVLNERAVAAAAGPLG